MPLKEKLTYFGERCKSIDGVALGNWALAVSIGVYQLSNQLISGPNLASLAYLGVVTKAGLTGGLFCFVQPFLTKRYQL